MKNNLSPRQLSPKIINTYLEKRYGIYSTQNPVIMSGGTINVGWKITVSTKKFILKIFSIPLENGRLIEEELDLYHHLARNKVNVPKVIATKSNHLVGKINIQNQAFPTILMNLEKLRRVLPDEITKKEIATLAKVVAKMHGVFASYDKKSMINKILLPKGIHTKGNVFIDLQSPNGANLSKNQKIRLVNLDIQMAEFTKSNPVPLNLKKGILHGDLSLGHMQFLTDESVYIYDFSDYTFGPVIWDLATFFVYLFKEGGITFLKWRKICSQFIKEYSKVMYISDENIIYIRTMIIDRLLFETRTLNRLSRIENRSVDTIGNMYRYKLAEKLLEEEFLVQ